MPRDDTPNWLTEGLAEVDAAETLEDACDEARGLVLTATTRLVEFLETHLMNNPIRGPEGHPLIESLRSYKEARVKLDDVYADMRQFGAVPHRCNLCGGIVVYDGTAPTIDYSARGRS